MINLLYFASLRETLKIEKEQMELSDSVRTIMDLKKLLSSRDGVWMSSFNNNMSLLVSVNHQMADDLTSISDGDEIAFFPPVTGG